MHHSVHKQSGQKANSTMEICGNNSEEFCYIYRGWRVQFCQLIKVVFAGTIAAVTKVRQDQRTSLLQGAKPITRTHVRFCRDILTCPSWMCTLLPMKCHWRSTSHCVHQLSAWKENIGTCRKQLQSGVRVYYSTFTQNEAGKHRR